MVSVRVTVSRIGRVGSGVFVSGVASVSRVGVRGDVTSGVRSREIVSVVSGPHSWSVTVSVSIAGIRRDNWCDVTRNCASGGNSQESGEYELEINKYSQHSSSSCRQI